MSELTTAITEEALPRGGRSSLERVVAAIRTIIEALAIANEVVVVIAIAADLVLTFANTILRSFFSHPILWQQDASFICMSVITFLGGAAAIHRNMTLSFTSVVDRLSGSKKDALVAVGWWSCLGVAAATFVGFPAYYAAAGREQMPTLSLHEDWTAIWIAVGYALILVFALEKLAALRLRANLVGIGLVGAAWLGLLGWRAAYGGAFADHRLIIPMLIVVVLAFVAGVPIAFVLGLSGIAFVVISQQGVIGQALAAYQLGISDFVLLALPFFMLAGALMTATGMAERLVSAVESVVGHWRAGLLITQVVAVYVFSGISGSKIADVSAVGGVLERPLLNRGYPSSEGAAVLAAGGAMGETVPPSIAMLVLGSISTLSVGALFLAGLVPALVLALAIIGGILIRARGGRLPAGPSFSLRRVGRTVPLALPALGLPAIIAGGVVAGIGTPTEVSSFGVVYGLVAALIYRDLNAARLWNLLRDAAVMAGMILLIVTTATFFSQAVTFVAIPTLITGWMTGIGSKLGFLVVSSVVLLIAGAVFEGLPALIVFAPILIPIATGIGINPLQYGILLILAMGIGSFAPPIGVGFFATCAIYKVPAAKAFRPGFWYTATLLVGLSVVIAVPAITTAIPHLLGFH